MGKSVFIFSPSIILWWLKKYQAGVRERLVQQSAEGSEEEGCVAGYERALSGVCTDFSGLRWRAGETDFQSIYVFAVFQILASKQLPASVCH